MDLRWFTGGLFQSGYHTRYDFDVALPIVIDRIPETCTLEGMLASSELDALVTVQPPEPFWKNADGIRRLWPKYREVERRYLARTGIFPIMHLVAVRRDVYERNRSVARSLFEAFTRAKELGLHRMRAVTVLAVGLPWLQHDLEEIGRLFGGEPFPYGVAANDKVLNTMSQYAEEPGVTSRRVGIDEMIVPELP